MTKAENELYNMIFADGKQMLSPEINSVDFHAMTHEDTETLGMFCDFTAIRGEKLRQLLIRGYLEDLRKDCNYNGHEKGKRADKRD